jgi:uncharacterized SAM-binding protein YcdF (DUF218 family)
MFFLKKLVTPFVLPPGIFILALIFSGALFILGKRRKIGIFNLALGLLLWIFSSALFSNYLIGGLESEFDLPPDVTGDCIILLGGGIIDEVPDFSGSGAPSDRMLGRIVTAVRLQKKLSIPIIVSGGRVFENRSSEAQIARRFLVDLGVEAGQIVTEENARNTYENAKYSAEICQRKNYQKPILVTSAFHMKRALLSFKKIGMEVIPYPAGFRSKNAKNAGWTSYLPRSGSLAATSDAFHEYLGNLFYRIAYGTEGAS